MSKLKQPEGNSNIAPAAATEEERKEHREKFLMFCEAAKTWTDDGRYKLFNVIQYLIQCRISYQREDEYLMGYKLAFSFCAALFTCFEDDTEIQRIVDLTYNTSFKPKKVRL